MEDGNIDEFGPDKKCAKYSDSNVLTVAETNAELAECRARVRYFERQNYFLRKIVDAQKDYASERENFTSSCISGQVKINTTPSFRLLPSIVVKEILKKISDQSKLLDCRLVSVEWNQMIEDTSELMKKISFPIWHPKPFMDLDIVKRKKVKRFDSESKLCIQDPNLAYQAELFNLVLENCGTLQELVLSYTTHPDTSSAKILQSNTSTINIAASNTLSIISIKIHGYGEEDAAGLSRFLLQLPKLKEIHMNGCTNTVEVDGAIITGLCEYIKNYETKMHLKKITLGLAELRDCFETEQWEVLTLLLVLCGKHKILICELPDIDINFLLEFTGSEILSQSFLQQRPLFTNKIDGLFTFHDDGDSLVNFDRIRYLNIADLSIYFGRPLLKLEELYWIKEIRGLKSLSMEKDNEVDIDLLPSSVAALMETFSAGLPLLEELRLKDDILGSLDGFPWLQNFPNLDMLTISSYEEIPTDLISQLAVLESLTILKLYSLENLKDEAFTVECMNRYATDNSNAILSTAPAIACFKQLQILVIEYCNKVTEDCLSNGIAKCKTLEKLEIKQCANLKEDISKFVKYKC